MTRRLAVFVPLFASFALLAACGSSPSTGDDGGGTLADGGSRADGGSLADGGAADAGRPDAGRVDGGRQDAGTTADAGAQCLESGCVDATGNYNTCLTCPVIGRLGPYDVDITQIACTFQACVRTTPDGGPQCTDGCIDENGNLRFQIRQGAITANCSGILNPTTHRATLTCTVPGFGNCAGDLQQPARTTCN